MNNFPRRSPRFQQQQPQSFTFTDSRSSSTISTSHPSPTPDNITLANQSQQFTYQPQSQFLSAQTCEVPLPSPSANDFEPFGRSYDMSGQVQNQNVQSNTTKQTQLNSQHHHNSFSQPQRPSYPPTSVNGVPPGLPPDFLAEAAKRAQMACLMRDLGDVSL